MSICLPFLPQNVFGGQVPGRKQDPGFQDNDETEMFSPR